MYLVAKQGRKEGRKGAWISHVVTHTWNVRYANVYKATGSILRPVVPALIPLFLARLPRFSPSSCAHPAGFLPNSAIHKCTRRSPEKDRRRHHVATPSTTSSHSLMYIQRPAGRSIGRSISRSPGIISPEVAGSEQSRVSLRRMNKILFSFHAAQRTRLNAAEEFRK